jgi:hypothetical protein
MRPTPIPDAEVWEGAERRVIGPPDGDLTSTEIGAVEALVDMTELGTRFSMRCVPEDDEAERILRGAPIWVEFLGQQLHPFLVEVGEAPVVPSLRVDVVETADLPVPQFEAFVVGVPDGEVRLFVAGVIEALQKMVESGLTPPDPT